MEIQFYHTNHHHPGFAPVKKGIMEREFHSCKEVFARRLAGTKTRSEKVYFLRKEATQATPRIAAQQEKVLHVFEKAMGIKPEGKVEVVENTFQRVEYVDGNWANIRTVNVKEKYFLYTVSREWAKNQPVSHILALICRNYYPEKRHMDWRSILKWLTEQKGVLNKDVKRIATEVIKDGGKIKRIPNNGIDSYAYALIDRRKNARRN